LRRYELARSGIRKVEFKAVGRCPKCRGSLSGDTVEKLDPLPGGVENLERCFSSRIIAADFDGFSFENRTASQEITPEIYPPTFSNVSG